MSGLVRPGVTVQRVRLAFQAPAAGHEQNVAVLAGHAFLIVGDVHRPPSRLGYLSACGSTPEPWHRLHVPPPSFDFPVPLHIAHG